MLPRRRAPNLQWLNSEACDAESMPGGSEECERELQASLLQEQDEEATLLRAVYEEPIQTVAAKCTPVSEDTCHVKDIAPHFDLDVSLAEAVLLQAAERAEAKASLRETHSAAALPIKTISPEESPRHTLVLQTKTADSQSTDALKSAACHRSPYEPHAQKRDQSPPVPWTPEGSPPLSHSEPVDAVPCHLDLDALQWSKVISSQPARPADERPCLEVPLCYEAKELETSTPKSTKPMEAHGAQHASALTGHDDDSGIDASQVELRLASHEFTTQAVPAERPQMPVPPARTEMPCILADPLRRRSVALGSSHKTSHSPPWRRDRYRTRSPRWGSSHKVHRLGDGEP